MKNTYDPGLSSDGTVGSVEMKTRGSPFGMPSDISKPTPASGVRLAQRIVSSLLGIARQTTGRRPSIAGMLAVIGMLLSIASPAAFAQTSTQLALVATAATGSTVGAQFNQVNIASGGVEPYSYAIVSGSVPIGTSLNLSTGIVSGTPTVQGNYVYTVQVTDGISQTNAAPISVMISPTTPLTLTASTATSTAVNGQFNQTNTAAGGATPYTYAITSGAPPAGTSLNASTGVVSGTASNAGSYNYTVTVSDNTGVIASANVNAVIMSASASLTLTASTTAPTLNAPVTLSATLSGATSPTGTVTFKDGAETLATVGISASTAKYTLSSLSTGSHSITASYSGDSNYNAVTSSALALSVGRPDPTTNAVVRAVTAAQVTSSFRFAQAQIQNVSQRLESLHDDNDMTSPDTGDSGLSSGDADATARPAGSTVTSAASSNGAAAQNTLPIGVLGNTLPRLNIGGVPLRIWASGNVDFGRINMSDGDNSRFTTSGVTLGADARVTPDIALGLSAGFGADRTTFDTSGSATDGRSYVGSFYGSWRMAPMTYLDAIVGYGRLRYTMDRWSSDGDVMLYGQRNGRALFGSIGLSTGTTWGPWRFNPYARLDATRVFLDAYQETGSDDWALAYARMNSSTVVLTGGIRISYTVAMPWGRLTPGARLGYQHTMGGSYTQQLDYVNAVGYGYAFGGAVALTNSAIIGASLSLLTRGGTTMKLEYLMNGDFGATRTQQVLATVQLAF